MALIVQILVCRLRVHDLDPITHPNFPGLALLRCRRCHTGVSIPERHGVPPIG